MHEAIILAGGFGTRLQPVLKGIPKAMAPVNGTPFLEYLLDYLRVNEITRVVISVGYKSEMITGYFGNRFKNIEVKYAKEEYPLGTGGGVALAMHQCQQENVFVFNGDTLFLVDLQNFIDRHRIAKTPISIALRKVEDVSRFGSITTDEHQILTSFGEKSIEKQPGWINGGIYLINKAFFLSQPFSKQFSIEKDCFSVFYKQKLIAGFPYQSYFLDIGIPNDFKRAQDEFAQLKYR